MPCLKITTISILTSNKDAPSLTKKGKRQGWPFKVINRAGLPLYLYLIDSLPDDIQVAWANWDQAQIDLAKEKGIEDKYISDLITEDEAREALSWPTRTGYYIEKKKQWDGVSRGLCEDARQILLGKFPQFKEIKQKKIENLEPILNVNNRTNLSPNPKPKDSLTSIPLMNINENDALKNNPKELINIRYFTDVKASAGMGFANYQEDSIDLQFSRRFLMQHFKLSGVQELSIITVFGNSMSPTLEEGQTVLVVGKEAHQRDGGIYIIRYESELYIKRIQKTIKSKVIQLISDNPSYKPIELVEDDLNQIEIIGRVAGRMMLEPI